MMYKALFTDEFLSYFRLDDNGKTLVLTDKTGLTRAVRLEEVKTGEIIRCEDCKHSIKKDYIGITDSGFTLYEYLCVKKSTVTHLEEHKANYFCADGERRETNG